ncbi:MAG: hypothetical protein U1A78_26945 [Polyangia bacterium]
MAPSPKRQAPPRLRTGASRHADGLGDRIAHWLLCAPWRHFLGVVAGFYLSAATFFASLLLGVGGTSSPLPVSFLDTLFMSLQALTVFGCGRLSAATLAAKAVIVSAVFVGWLALLLSLALLMVRLIRLRPFWQPGSVPHPPEIPVERLRPEDCN